MTAADGADVPLSSLTLGGKIGDGGQGEVHSVREPVSPGRSALLYKSYRSPGQVDGGALGALVAVYRALPPEERDRLDAGTAWPLCRVVDGGRPVGFLMYEAPAEMTWRTAQGAVKLTELQFLLREPKTAWQDIRQPAPGQRRELTLALVTLIERLHSWGLVLGDVSQANILWTVRPAPAVYLLDCDGFRVTGEPPVLAQADTPDWADPLARPGSVTVDSDRYKAALAAGRILSREAYAVPGGPLGVLAGELDERQETAVRERFAQAGGALGTRPTLAEWRTALSGRDVIKLTAAAPAPRPQLNRAMLDGVRDRGSIPLRPPGA
ncbi:hypothetical protein ACIBCM_34410 [Streptomyces sp. NPDC051018]|uniref:hypothetical protein n=1 Tax=Streptomyces sp. NPDC051018 TaxID=3365639 RepID=UPI0037A9244C